ncbi:hypothetical protein GOP47_0003698 [Adiantum capillus-veneris]|uniref:Cupin type-1 domain-containing protein n=1 Tax=Adiantum capillus-veneris TaxID=13818 RepID=A0A9D4ZPN1_ADICA|nr:hypothetical protein GOP47_0003698 [Adiantum capillus-veneris]
MKHRGTGTFTFLLGFLLLLFLSSSHGALLDNILSRDRRGGGRGEEEETERRYGRVGIELGHAQELLRSKGGRLRVWSEQIDVIRNIRIGVSELDLEEDGLLVPHYMDVDKIAYVLQGCGVMGAVISEFQRIYIRRVQKGDVVALPKGTIYWWYNEGNERHRVLCAGDTTLGVNPGRFHQFGLAGAKCPRFGSLLHGFRHDTLATAWGVDEKTARSLLDNQNEAGIIKVQQKIRFPELPRGGRQYEELEDNLQYKDHTSGRAYFEELKYSIRAEHPDYYVRDGGWFNLVTCQKLPALAQVGFSAMRVSLEKNAMCAPALCATLISCFTPSTSFLGGRNSVYRGVPMQVIAAAFNVDEDTLSDLGRDQEIIFPPRSHGERHREEEERSRGKHGEQRQPAWATM